MIVIVGGGVMGEALLVALLARGEAVRIVEPRAERREVLARHGAPVDSQADLHDAEIVVLAMKPQQLDAALASLHVPARAIVLSIVAGATLEHLTSKLSHAAIVRAMPNTPARIGRGATVWTASAGVGADRRDRAATLLSALGHELYVDDEALVEAGTGLTGPLPAFFFLLVETLVDVGTELGFARADATALVLATLAGSAELARASEHSPANLREQVTSPGGATAAGLAVLQREHFAEAIAKAVHAVKDRAKALVP